MSEIDLIDRFDEVEGSTDEQLDDFDEKNGKRRTTKQQLKVRRAIENHQDHKRFRQEVDYLNEYSFDE